MSVNDPLDTVLSHYDQPRCSKRPDPNPNEAPFLLESTEESSAGDCCRTRRWHELPSTEADGELTTRGLLYIVLAKAYSRERCGQIRSHAEVVDRYVPMWMSEVLLYLREEK